MLSRYVPASFSFAHTHTPLIEEECACQIVDTVALPKTAAEIALSDSHPCFLFLSGVCVCVCMCVCV